MPTQCDHIIGLDTSDMFGVLPLYQSDLRTRGLPDEKYRWQYCPLCGKQVIRQSPERLRALFDPTIKNKAIADQFGISRERVRQLRERLGISAIGERLWWAIHRPELATSTLADFGSKYGVRAETARAQCNRHGIQYVRAPRPPPPLLLEWADRVDDLRNLTYREVAAKYGVPVRQIQHLRLTVFKLPKNKRRPGRRSRFVSDSGGI